MNHPPVADISAYNAFKGSKASMRRAIGTTYPAQRTARPPDVNRRASPCPSEVTRPSNSPPKSSPVGHFLIAHLCTLIECAEPSFFDRGDVHEHILAAVIGLNESIAFCRVEPLHRSSCHLGRLPYPIGPRDNLMPIWKASKTPRGEPAGPEYGLMPEGPLRVKNRKSSMRADVFRFTLQTQTSLDPAGMSQTCQKAAFKTRAGRDSGCTRGCPR